MIHSLTIFILECRNMYENVECQYIEGLLHLLGFCLP
jgi:hypothetical protein